MILQKSLYDDLMLKKLLLIINVENIFISGLFDEQKVQKNSIDLK